MNHARKVYGELTADELHELSHVQELRRSVQHLNDHLMLKIRSRLGAPLDEELDVEVEGGDSLATARGYLVAHE